MSIIRKTCNAVMGLAALATALMPALASAQETAKPQSQQYSITYVAPSAEMMQTRVELAKGFTLTPEEATQVSTNGCVVGPMATTTRGLYAWAAKKGVRPCTPDFYKKVDDSIGKESTLAFRAMAGADGFEYCPNMKVANLGNNRESCRTYPYNPDYNPQGQVGKYADVNWAPGGGTTKAQALTALGGALIAGPGTAATGALLQKTCDHCNSPTFNVGGGSSVALSNADANAGATVGIVGTFGGAPGSCSSCGGAVATDPKHY